MDVLKCNVIYVSSNNNYSNVLLKSILEYWEKPRALPCAKVTNWLHLGCKIWNTMTGIKNSDCCELREGIEYINDICKFNFKLAYSI